MRDTRLDDLRVLSIAAIIIIHGMGEIPGWSSNLTWTVLRDASLGILFFVSGVVMREPTSIRSWASQRFLRIYPLYAAALAVFALIYRPTPLALTGAVTLLGPLFEPLLGESVRTLWFVPVIVYCYAGYAWAKKDWLRWGVLFGALLVLKLLGVGDPRILAYTPAFVVGVMWDRKPRFAVAGAAFVASVLALSLSKGGEGALGRGAAAGISLAAPLLAYPLANVGVHALAYGSYGAYLAHRPILELLPPGLPAVGATLVLSFALGWIVQRAYDLALARLSGHV